MDRKELREHVGRVESEISVAIGNGASDCAVPSTGNEKTRLGQLIDERQRLLNRLWNPTEEAMNHFRLLNNHLLQLTVPCVQPSRTLILMTTVR